MRKEFKWFHADDGSAENVESADGDLVLFDELGTILQILITSLLVYGAYDYLRNWKKKSLVPPSPLLLANVGLAEEAHFQLDFGGRSVNVHDGVKTGTDDGWAFENDDLSVKDFGDLAHFFDVTQDESA